MKYATRILHSGCEVDPDVGALSTPVYQASTFQQHDVDNLGKYQYSRSGNPTREALENTLAALENGTHAYAFSSGMAAISSTLAILLQGTGGRFVVIYAANRRKRPIDGSNHFAYCQFAGRTGKKAAAAFAPDCSDETDVFQLI